MGGGRVRRDVWGDLRSAPRRGQETRAERAVRRPEHLTRCRIRPWHTLPVRFAILELRGVAEELFGEADDLGDDFALVRQRIRRNFVCP